MEYFVITGVGSGIGKSLLQQCIGKGKIIVLSRTCEVDHPDIAFIPCDLSQPGEVERVISLFPFPEKCERLTWINNAGTIGMIERCGELGNGHYETVLRLNLLSVCQLTEYFVHRMKARNFPGILVNISSGAANSPIAGWSAYCASKAGLDMFVRTVDAELRESKHTHVHVFSFHPGMVDTPMQEQIRGTSPAVFSAHVRFATAHEQGELLGPDFVAERLLTIFKDPEKISTPVVSIRDYLYS
jgi:benzil reductase ((S)-benzoin forming)